MCRMMGFNMLKYFRATAPTPTLKVVQKFGSHQKVRVFSQIRSYKLFDPTKFRGYKFIVALTLLPNPVYSIVYKSHFFVIMKIPVLLVMIFFCR